MNDEIKISDEAREAAEIFFDTHPDSPRWDSEVMDLALRFDSFAKARTEYACLNWKHRDAKLQEMLKQRDAEIRELRADVKFLLQMSFHSLGCPYPTNDCTCGLSLVVKRNIAMFNKPPVTTQMAKICKGTMSYGVCDVCLSMANLSNKQWLIRSPSGERRVQICQECVAMSNETKGQQT